MDALDAEGFIALQVHAGKTGVIRWRHIRIRELESVMQPGDSLFFDAEAVHGPEELKTLPAVYLSIIISPPEGE